VQSTTCGGKALDRAFFFPVLDDQEEERLDVAFVEKG